MQSISGSDLSKQQQSLLSKNKYPELIQKIRVFIKIYEGQQIKRGNKQVQHEQKYQNLFYLIVQNANKTKVNTLLHCKCQNNQYKISLQFDLRQTKQLNNIYYFGISQLANIIKMMNEQQKQCFKFMYKEKQGKMGKQNAKETVCVKIVNQTVYLLEQIQAIIGKAIEGVFRLIHLLENTAVTQQKKLIYYRQQLMKMTKFFQYHRQNFQNHTEFIQIKENKNFVNFRYKVTLSETQKNQFQNEIRLNKKKLKQKFNNHTTIFRCIQFSRQDYQQQKQQYGLKYEQRFKKDGSLSTITKCKIMHSISPVFSIHSQTSKMRQEEERKKNNGKIQQNQNANKKIISTFAKKVPLDDDFNSIKCWDNQKHFLVLLRDEKCTSINSYYCRHIKQRHKGDQNNDSQSQRSCTAGTSPPPEQTKPKPKNLSNITKKIDEIFSDFHNETAQSQSLNKLCYFIPFILTLCQGLIFLNWNAFSHRDLKPQNILLSNRLQAKLIDFGSACHNMSLRKFTADALQPKELYTNTKYNLIFSELPSEVQCLFPNSTMYNRQIYFDIYAFGRLLEEIILKQFVKIGIGQFLYDCLRYLADICMQANPSDRPGPQNIYLFLQKIDKYYKCMLEKTA